MKKFLEHNKDSLAEVALLCIFMLGVLLAWVLVTFRSRVHFSYSVPLPYSGVSVALPAGEGWQQLDQWVYDPQNNSFVLAGQFQLYRGQSADVFLQWEYLLAEGDGTIDEKIDAAVVNLGGAIIDRGVSYFHDNPMPWARFAQASREKDGIVGIAELALGRHLKLIIYTEEPELLLETFEGAVEAIEYVPNSMADEGVRFVGYLKRFLVNSILQDGDQAYRELLYITRRVMPVGNTAQLAGFSAERFSPVEGTEPVGITATRLQFLGGKNSWTDRGHFTSNNNMSEYSWQNSRQINRGELEIVTEINVDKQRILTSNQNQKQFKLSSFCIPEMLLEFAAGEFISFDSESVLLDMVIYDGRVVPAVMSKKSVMINEHGESGYEVRLDLLYGGETYETLFLDSNKNVIEKRDKSIRMLISEKSSWDELYQKFDRRADTFKELFPLNDEDNAL